jgi:hypothetical protein
VYQRPQAATQAVTYDRTAEKRNGAPLCETPFPIQATTSPTKGEGHDGER